MTTGHPSDCFRSTGREKTKTLQGKKLTKGRAAFEIYGTAVTATLFDRFVTAPFFSGGENMSRVTPEMMGGCKFRQNG